jgi:hypothetical protein
VQVEGESPASGEFELQTVERGAEQGDAIPGCEVELFRVRREAGEEVGRELMHTDLYPPELRLPVPGKR